MLLAIPAGPVWPAYSAHDRSSHPPSPSLQLQGLALLLPSRCHPGDKFLPSVRETALGQKEICVSSLIDLSRGDEEVRVGNGQGLLLVSIQHRSLCGREWREIEFGFTSIGSK